MGQGLLQRIRKVGSRSDLRTRGIIDRILCDTLRQKLTCPLEFLWASHVFPGQDLRVWAGCRNSAGRHPLQEEPLSAPTMRICCPCESIFTLCATHYLFPTRYSSLEVTYCFLSFHSLIEQKSIGHPLCDRHFREERRIKLTLTSKKADVREVIRPHSELCLWYMLDMRSIRQWQLTPVLLAWTIPGMAEPGGLPSMRSHRVGHDWSDLAEAEMTL